MRKRWSDKSGSRRSTERPSGGMRARSYPLRIRWSSFRPLYDFWGNEIKRFYQLETLASAVERMIRSKDRFVIPSVQEVLGPAPVTSLAFELFQEGKYQLIFRLRACNVKRKEGVFAFVAAKRPADYSDIARQEHGNLRLLNQRARDYVVRPFRGGMVYLPDRHGRTEHGREIYAYVTQWLTGFHEMGVNANLQLIINIVPRHTFTIAQTEDLKGRIIEIIVRSYDPAKGDCMEMPQIASGDFVVTAPKKGVSRLKLIACRRLLEHVTPAKLIHRIVTASWEWGDRTFHLAPEDPEILFGSLVRAVGRDTARTWLGQYASAVASKRLPESLPLPPDVAEKFAFR